MILIKVLKDNKMTNNTTQHNEDDKLQQKRSIRVFISSTFRDMIEERDAFDDPLLARTKAVLP